MKNIYKYINAYCILAVLIFCTLTACAPKQDYDALSQENADLKATVSELTEQVSDLTNKLEADETVKKRIVGGFTGVVNSSVDDWMNGYNDGYGYRYYVTITPFQDSPVLIRFISAEPVTLKENVAYFFKLKLDDAMSAVNLPIEVSKQDAAKKYAPFPPQEYWFDSVMTPLGAEDSGVNGIQFFWEEVE